MIEWYKHNHPGYSNCPRCVERILELEAELATLRGSVASETIELRKNWQFQFDRAEKTEAQLATVIEARDECYRQGRLAQARVAELLQELYDHDCHHEAFMRVKDALNRRA